MHVKKNLMLWVAVFALALPLLLTGTASAKYMGDGAVQDGVTGGWKTPNDMVCIVGLHADGTLDIAPGVTNSRDCIYYTTGLTSMTMADVTSTHAAVVKSAYTTYGTCKLAKSSYIWDFVNNRCLDVTACGGTDATTKGTLTWNAGDSKCYDSAACTVAGAAGNDGAKHALATSICVDGSGAGISLKDRDRTFAMCAAKGGTWKQTSDGIITNGTDTLTVNSVQVSATPGFGGACIAYGRQFKGQDASGTPLAFGTKGTVASTGTNTTGFCYAKIDTTLVAAASCPSVVGSSQGTKTATSSAALGYTASAATPTCTYDYGVNGKITADIYKADGTKVAKNTVVNFGAFTTMGDCLNNGGSWANWIPASTTVTDPIGGTATIMTFDHTRQAVNADDGCLHCHSSLTEYNGPAEREKDSYLKTGHKNMLRKVTAGNNYAGADGVAYTAYAAGTINFATPTAQISGVDKPLLYLFGDWMAAAPGGLDVVVSMSGAAKYNGGSDYSCAACHTAGWSNTSGTAGLCTISSKTLASTCTASGGVWTPLSGVQAIGTPGYAAKQPGDSFPAITFGAAGQWDSDGITCGRCHNATGAPVTAAQIAASAFPATAPTNNGMGALSAGVLRNSLCFGCHQSMAKTNNGIGADADLNNPTGLIVKNTATAPAYVPGFSGHVLGNSFLNSPHARFTGSVVPNSLGKYDLAANTAANYNSTFKGYTCWQSPTSNSPAKTKGDGTEITTKAECETLYGAGSWRADTSDIAAGADGIQGTCATCHDVHNSLFVTGQEGMRKECTTCHVDNAADYGLTAKTIAHPTGVGTPRELEATEPAEPCVICHMPKPTAGDFPMHVFRVNADAAYSTFPTGTEFGAFTGTTKTKQNANTAVDSKGYTNAVWVDLDLSCGQCHNASGSAHLISKAGLAPYANAMHDGGAAPTTTCATCHATSQNGKAAIKGSMGGKNHHGAYVSCETCHSSVAYGSRPGSLATTTNGATTMTDKGFCTTCHNAAAGIHALIQGTNHHNGNCVDCHQPNDNVGAGGVTGPGVIPVVVNCTTCHANKSLTTMNHVSSATGTYAPTACESCHSIAGVTYAGVKPTTTTGLCDKCHAVSQNVTDRFAYGIHTQVTKPAFTWTNDATTPFKVNFDASASTSCSSYTWNLGGGTGSTSGVTTSATYTTSNAATVTLTCGSVSVSKTVNPRGVKAPLLIPSATAVATGYSVLFTDTTGTQNGTGNGSILVMWGDGNKDTVARGGTATHLYKMARTYPIRMIVSDTGATGVAKQMVSKTISVTVNKLNITGVVTHGTPTAVNLQGATVTLKVGTKTLKKAITKADGSYTLLNVVPFAALSSSVKGTNTQYDVVPSKKLNKTTYTFTPAVLHPDAGATAVNFNAAE